MTNRPNPPASKRALPAEMPGHWDTLEGCMIATDYLGKERADLCHGELSDLALANRQYMAGRGDLDLTIWQAAAKERIRWLSAQLAATSTLLDEIEARVRGWMRGVIGTRFEKGRHTAVVTKSEFAELEAALAVIVSIQGRE